MLKTPFAHLPLVVSLASKTTLQPAANSGGYLIIPVQPRRAQGDNSATMNASPGTGNSHSSPFDLAGENPKRG